MKSPTPVTIQTAAKEQGMPSAEPLASILRDERRRIEQHASELEEELGKTGRTHRSPDLDDLHRRWTIIQSGIDAMEERSTANDAPDGTSRPSGQ